MQRRIYDDDLFPHTEKLDYITDKDKKEIEFLKRKLMIDEFFKKETDPLLRKTAFKKLLMLYHPDKRADIDP